MIDGWVHAALSSLVTVATMNLYLAKIELSAQKPKPRNNYL